MKYGDTTPLHFHIPDEKRLGLSRKSTGGTSVAQLWGMSEPTDPHRPPKQETFRTVHEILEETARVLETSARGLKELSSDPLIGVRDSMMLAMLSQTRAEAARSLERILLSATRPGEETWLQYAPVFGNREELSQRIAASKSGEAAYDVVTGVDAELEQALGRCAEASPSARELLRQTESVVLQVQRSGRVVVESAQDI